LIFENQVAAIEKQKETKRDMLGSSARELHS